MSSILSRFKNIDKRKTACNFYIFSSTSFSIGCSYFFLRNNRMEDINENENVIYYRNINI